MDSYNKNYKILHVTSLFILFILIIKYSIELLESYKIEEKYLFGKYVKKYSYNKYVLLEIYDLLNHEECDILINLAKAKGLEPSRVSSFAKGKTNSADIDYRNSEQAWLYDSEHPVVKKISDFSEKITGIPKKNQERLQVAHYNEKGKFEEHYDSCYVDDEEFCNKINRGAGNRRTTLLIYLNDDFDNGETNFVELGLKIKPEKGKAILFSSTDNEDNLLFYAKHKGNVVLNGEKWIATKWSRAKQYY
jgi:prolyl 4-hydroxylase